MTTISNKGGREEWKEARRRFMELWDGDKSSRAIGEQVRDRYHQLRKRDEDWQALNAALAESCQGPPTVLDDTEYNDILKGDEIWEYIQKNSGK